MGPRGWTYHPRDLDGAWRAIDDLRGRVDDMQIADEVTERVTTAIEQHRMFGFTVLQKTGAALLGGVAVADLVLQILGLHS